MEPSANSRQVGGEHYRNTGAKLQHWDLVVMFGWDYFQGQVTKYLMRWKYKYSTPEKQLEDLKKAAHFLQKYIEEAEAGAEFPSMQPLEVIAVAGSITDVEKGIRAVLSRINPSGWVDYTFEGAKDEKYMYRCKHCKTFFTTDLDEWPGAVHECGAAPGPGYVQQEGQG